MMIPLPSPQRKVKTELAKFPPIWNNSVVNFRLFGRSPPSSRNQVWSCFKIRSNNQEAFWSSRSNS
ncbi:hypothetical protein Hanom_Chr16g01443431 [Helianthus anomalus]